MRSGYIASWTLPVVALLAVSFVSGQNDGLNKPRPSPASVSVVSDKVTNLAQKIAQSIASPDSKTEIFSPISIAGALSLLLLGAGGRTEQELRRVLGFDDGAAKLSLQQIHSSFGRLFQDLVTNDPSLEPLVLWRLHDKCNQGKDKDDLDELEPANTTATAKANRSPSHLISVVNGLFLQNGLKPSHQFLADVHRFYQSGVVNLDFAHDPNGAAASINDWCARETYGKIKEMVTSQTVSNSHMIIGSALYFKAQWEATFPPFATRPRPFYLGSREEPPINVVSMVTSGCFPYYDATAQLDAKIIGLPYKTGNTTMYIVIPNDSTREKLQQLQATLGADQLNMLIDQMETKKGMVRLPKLSISNRMQLSQVLQRLDVHDLFDPAQSNLSRMLDETDVPQTGTRQETSVQEQQPAAPSVQPVIARDNHESIEISQTTTRRPVMKSANGSLPKQLSNQRGYGVKPRSTTQPPMKTQPQFQEPNTIGQTMNFSVDAAVCDMVENCQYTSTHNCTCTVLPASEDAAECGTHVARYETDSDGKNCIFSTENDEMERGYICIKQNYRASSRKKLVCCKKRGCGFFNHQCYCCEQNIVRNKQISDTPQRTVTVRLWSHSRKTDTASNNSNASQRQRTWQSSQDGEINCRPQPEDEAPAEQPIRQLRQIDHQNRQQSSPSLHGQSNATRLFVNEIIAQVQLDVNEKGTEGGAVTLALIDRIGPSFTLEVDSPFLMMIRHDITKSLLFYAAVYDPRP